MDEMLMCRVCLATNVKLLNLHQYGLALRLQNSTGIPVKISDGLPWHICCYCSAQLRRCNDFRFKCHQSFNLLSTLKLQYQEITSGLIEQIQEESKVLMIPLTVDNNLTVIELTHVENHIKEEKPSENTIKCEIEFKTHFKDEDDDNKEESKVKVNHVAPNDLGKEIEVKFEQEIQFQEDSLSESDDEPLSLQRNKVEKKEVKKEIKTVSNLKESEKNLEDSNIELKILTKEEQINDVLSRRLSTNYKGGLFKCDKCYKGFLHEETYNNHMLLHDLASGSFLCEICEMRFSNERKLRAHVTSSHLRRYICKLCNHVARNTSQAHEHQKWHKGVTYDCLKCFMSFRSSTSYLTHLRLKHPTGHICEVCGQSFLGKVGLNAHRLKAHKNIKRTPLVTSSPCTACRLPFRTAAALDRHLATASPHNGAPDMTHYCIQCGDSFDSDVKLMMHKKSHKTETQAVKCQECSRVYSDSSNYATHYRKVHLGVRGERSPGKLYVCEVCGKKCTSNAALTYHQRRHTGEKPFQCSFCSKTFGTLQNMHIHIRTHTGERPYRCSTCPKAFRHKAALNRHVRIHTGDKPYSCSCCSKSFSQSNSLKTHVNTVHLKLPAPYKKKHKPVE